MSDRRSSSRYLDMLNIPLKANRILNIVLIGMLLIMLRVWHLSVVQYDEKLEESRKPQRRMVLEPAKRGTIRDRFNIPLAINKIQYNISILYSQIRQIPITSWTPDAEGKKVKRPKRKEYILALSELLGQELEMDPERIEDLIHAKAALYNQIPFVLKEDITEEQYYRLKMMERDWVGISVQRVPKRYYPLGKVAGDIVGYMGAINKQEYEGIIREIKALNQYVAATDLGEVIPLPEGMTTSDQVRRRLKDLNELAYSVNDSIGKMGIEGRYENILRGFHGKKSYYSDARGNFLRELPGTRDPLSGKRILLTISSELQEYAEQLLIRNEKIRQTRLSHLESVKKTIFADKEPWIKGGAVVAMDPNTGEILALASHPRFDPNDFIFSGDVEVAKVKKENVLKWLENESYLGDVWNQLRPLEREVWKDQQKEAITYEDLQLTWANYLDQILSKNSVLKESVLTSGTIQEAVWLQQSVDALLAIVPKGEAYQLFNAIYKNEDHQTHGKKLGFSQLQELEKQLDTYSKDVEMHKRVLDRYVGDLNKTYDQVLLIDILRVAVNADRFNDELLDRIGNQSLSHYKEVSSAMIKVQDAVKKMTKELFHQLDFKKWRKLNEKEYFKRVREDEKAARRYAKPYIDYLDGLENEMFRAFWEANRWQILAAFLTNKDAGETDLQVYFDHFKSWHQEILQGAHQEAEWAKAYIILKNATQELPLPLTIQYLQTLRGFQELNRPLLGKYRYLRKNSDQTQQEKHLAAAFYPKIGYGYGRSQAFRQTAMQGSIFKLVTAYASLVQRYRQLEAEGKDLLDLNPLEMVDQVFYKGKDLFVGYDTDGQPLSRYYKGGRLPRSIATKIGKLDVLKALEVSSNPYFSLLAGEFLESPSDLADAAKQFSFGHRTGIDLPGEITGSVPDDLEYNRTGLYSLAIGQHTLVVTPLQTNVMLSSLINGGRVFKPKIVQMMVGKEPKRGKELASADQDYPYQDQLALIGINFSLFLSADTDQKKSLVTYVPSQVNRTIFMPDEVSRILLEGMCRVVARSHHESLSSLTRLYRSAPSAINDYVELKSQLIGKTSTAEVIENIDLDLDVGTNIYTHVWFGGISFDHDVLDEKGTNRFVFRDSEGKPELVVVVYLRYGGYGKEAAPLAAQVAKKWREIKQRHRD